MIDVDGTAMKLDYDDARRVVRVVERDGTTGVPLRRRRPVERVDPDGLPSDGRGTSATCWSSRSTAPGARRATSTTPSTGRPLARRPGRRDPPVRPWTSVGCRWRSSTPTASSPRCDGIATVSWRRRSTPSARRPRSTTTSTVCSGITPPWGAATVLVHDEHGRLVRTERGDAVHEYGYTSAGRVCRGVEPGDVGWSATFGSHGAVETLTDAAGSTVTFGYDAIGNVTVVTAPDGAVLPPHPPTRSAAWSPRSNRTGRRRRRAYDRRRPGRSRSPISGERLALFPRISSAVRSPSTAPDGAETRVRLSPRGPAGVDHRAGWTGVAVRARCGRGRPVAMIDPAGGRSVVAPTPRRAGCAAGPARQGDARSSSTTPPAASPPSSAPTACAAPSGAIPGWAGGVDPRARRRRRAPPRAPAGRLRTPRRADRRRCRRAAGVDAAP